MIKNLELKKVQYIYFKDGYDKLIDLGINEATRDEIFQAGEEQFKEFQTFGKIKMVQSFYEKEEAKDNKLKQLKNSAPGYNKMKTYFNDFMKHFKVKQSGIMQVADTQAYEDFLKLSRGDLIKVLKKFDEKKYFGTENKKFLKLGPNGLRNLDRALDKLKSEASNEPDSEKFKSAYLSVSQKIPRDGSGKILFSEKRKVIYNGAEYEILKLDDKIKDDIKKIKQEKKDAKKEGDNKLEEFKANLETNAAFVSNLDLSSLKVVKAGTRTSGTTGSVNTSAFTSGATSGSKLESYVKLLKIILRAPVPH